MNQSYQRPTMDLVRRAVVDEMSFTPRWSVEPLPAKSIRHNKARLFLVPPSQDGLRRELSAAFPHDEVQAVRDPFPPPPHGVDLVFVSRSSWSDGIQDDDLNSLLRVVRELEPLPGVTLDVVTDKAVASPLFPIAGHPADGVHVGLARTLAAERPDWTVRCLCLRDLSPETLGAALDRALPDVPGTALCIDSERFATVGLAAQTLGNWPAESAFRTGGTYVILGGTGGLGGVFADYLAENYQAEIVLVGRRTPDDIEAIRGSLRSLGARAVHHHLADLTDETALRDALDAHPVINGVIHSALVLDDCSLSTMSDHRLLRVLRPKVHGARNLVQALRGRQVDFCLFFSSMQSFLANAGQGNYAAASVAADSYADLIRESLLIDARIVNWGFWGSVGVVAKPEYRERMAQLGIGSIEPAEGLAVIERFLASEHRQIAVLKADRRALQRMGIEQQSVDPPNGEGFATLLPSFDDTTQEAARNRALADRIEGYARAALHRLELPTDSVPSRTRLLAAVRAIPGATSPSRDVLLRDHPEIEGHLTLLDRCVEALPAVIRGQLDPLDVLFPHGSFDLVAPVYRSNPIADYFNSVSGHAVAAYQQLTGDRHTDILEIGAGTGSTTRFVVDRLDPKRTSYTFTDVSHAFLNRARDAFADHPTMKFEICDVTDPPTTHDSCHDVVVATNVLHATPDVPATLRNVRRMLREGGVLVLSEITARQDYATLTFGLTDGWWLGSDAYRLEHSPLLSSGQWQRLLREADFGRVATHGGPEQQVLVAYAGSVDASVEVEDSVSGGDAGVGVGARGGAGVGERVELFVRGVIAETMRFDVAEVERDRAFRDMGIDSLISRELLKPLSDVVGYLPATLLFEFPTVGRLSEYLVREHGEVLDAALPGGSVDAPAVVEDSLVREADIAIIGMSARLPAAPTIGEFWDNLVAGVDATSAVPPERWKADITAGPDPMSYTDRGAFVDDIDAFDHTFFSLTPRDAAVMDPQERLVLEETYHALLDAGYGRADLEGGDTGVFVGVMNGGYAWHTPNDPTDSPTTSLFWSIANRTSYHFDWHGPSLAADTACSASLTALHLACQSLRAGECGQAVVSGVNLITHPRQFALLSNMGMLSRAGTCRPFGEGADGFVDGEGVVCLVLKPLAQAQADGDRIHAIVAGSAVNAGGRANGYTAPNVAAQHAVATRALSAAGISPGEVGYVEAHGTGTELGDPVEIRALSKAYESAGEQRIRLGSVKSNVGHLESAAGLSGVLKSILQMQYRKLVPSLHAERPNPHIDFPVTPFVLNTSLTDWPGSLPLVSAVSSFGAGGANAHVIIRGVPAARAQSAARPGRDCYVIPLSHHSTAGLQILMDDLRALLLSRRVDMDSLARTLACGRDVFRNRVAIPCRDQNDLVRALEVDLQRWPQRNPLGPTDVLTTDTAPDVAALFESGGTPTWERFYASREPISLPPYPFLRHRHWVDSIESDLGGIDGLVSAHRIAGEAIVPAAWSLALLNSHARGRTLANTIWQRRIDDPRAVEVVGHGDELSLVGIHDGEVFCTADVVDVHPSARLAAALDGGRRIRGDEVYAEFRTRGYEYGADLRGIRWAEVGADSVRAFLHVDRSWGLEISPALLDAGMQLSILLPTESDSSGQVYVPYQLERMTVTRVPVDEAVYCTCRERPGGGVARTFDIDFADATGAPLIFLQGAVSVAAMPQQERVSSAFEVFELN